MKNSLFNFQKFKESFIYAWGGIWALLKKEQNLWIIAAMAMAVIIFSWLIGLNAVEKAIIVFTCTAVFGAEILNTALELVSDKFHLEDSADIKVIKDVMAGFVLIWAIASVVIGILIFWPYLF